MLVIRMQRTGRKGHAHFRVVVQDSRQSPTSGKVVALVGNYDPHAKTANLVSDKIDFYLKNGAQPSDRAALLFKKEGIKLPKWVSVDTKKQAKTRHPDKLQKDQLAPAQSPEAADQESAVEPSDEVATPEEASAAEEPAKAEVKPTDDTAPEEPADSEK